jgi:hypothetical protein
MITSYLIAFFGLLAHAKTAARIRCATWSVSNWPLEKSRRFKHSYMVIASD